MNPENRWVKQASMIPWEAIEEKYAAFFSSKTGMPAKHLRMALGSLLIQKQLGFSERELVEKIVENPYFQYFIGLPGYQTEAPFVPSLLVEFRKRLHDEVLTIGSKGRNVVLYSSYGAPLITKDGVTIAKEIELEDSFENMGAQLVKEVATMEHPYVLITDKKIQHKGHSSVTGGNDAAVAGNWHISMTQPGLHVTAFCIIYRKYH